ncbi:MAG: RNA polymerase sigma factor RpoH [Endozoicomonadaceae bacterium]|nr:RNA polymerase sigma factor RpoH [Endozoicomonadaceae bacterium]
MGGTYLQLTEFYNPRKDLTTYLQSIRSIALLSAAEEQVLAEKLYFNQDLESARQLVLAHLRFVVHIAKTYSGYGLSLADLIQEGNIGLMKAVKRFNPKVGVRLVSFAVHWIKAEMHEFILKNWRIVKIATTKAQRKLFFNLRSAKKKLGWLTPKEAKSMADELGVPTKTVLEMEGRLSNQDVPFDGFLKEDEPDHAVLYPEDYLSDTASNPSIVLEKMANNQHNLIALQEALLKLDERSRDILYARWLDEDNKLTLQELSVRYKVSAERIRQIEKNALCKLKASLEKTLH